MMAGKDADSLIDLLLRAKEGSEEAASRLHECLGPNVVRAVRRKLPAKLRALFDSHDFAQAAWASFFRRLREVSTPTVPAELKAFVRSIAENKVVDEVRSQLVTLKRCRDRVVSLDADPSLTDAPLRSPEPSPSAHVSAAEMLERLTAGQSPQVRQVVALRLEGASHSEIAAVLGVSERTVFRMLSRLAHRTQ